MITTASTCAAETARGRHTFKIVGYSMHKGLAAGKFIRSATFYVGGHGWSIRFYPNGHAGEDGNNGFICVYLELMTEKSTGEVQVAYDIRLVDQLTGESKVWFNPVTLRAFTGQTSAWGARTFIRRTELEASTYLREDRIVIECNVTVIVPKLESKTQLTTCEIQAPPSDLSVDFGKLLKTEEGADVVFKVQEESFRAHRIVLAARSPVFKAELYGPFGDKNRRVILVEDMHPDVFRALLHFIYTDSLPAMDGVDGGESKEMIKNLLVAADRYGVERMKLVCASMLSKRLDADSVSATLALADQYNCSELRGACIRYIISSNSMDEVVASRGYKELKRACPAATVELWEKASKSRKILYAEQREIFIEDVD